MKTHTTLGAEILSEGRSPYLTMGAEIALNHHECWDGSGYPNGIAGEQIPVSARIMNICDVYDALRSKRPYKPPFSHARATEIITQGDGRTSPGHFDPGVLAVFREHHQTFQEIYERLNHEE
jgi:putative two-component system response regulator